MQSIRARHQIRRSPGFTIVEMLTVIGIIGLLMAILLPALRGVRNRGAKTEESNAIRQVGLAWNMYANSNNDACLPGFIDKDLFDTNEWRSKYDFMDRSDVPSELAQPWTWRLMTYLDFDHKMVHGHVDDDFDMAGMTAQAIAADPELYREAEDIAFQPGFGYNAMYIGGWWETVDPDLKQPISRYAREKDQNGRPVNVVSRSIGTIKRSSQVMIFCSSTFWQSEEDSPVPLPGLKTTIRRDQPGAHYVVPPVLQGEVVWTSGGQIGPQAINVLNVAPQGAQNQFNVIEPTPIGRYTGQMAVLMADGSTGSDTPQSYLDPRKWIDSTTAQYFCPNGALGTCFSHSPYTPPPP